MMKRSDLIWLWLLSLTDPETRVLLREYRATRRALHAIDRRLRRD